MPYRHYSYAAIKSQFRKVDFIVSRNIDIFQEMEKIDQITARELNVDKRNEAVSVLKELIQKCKSDPSNVKRDEILEFIKKQNNPILNAVITV
jgi:hypothetical protein